MFRETGNSPAIFSIQKSSVWWNVAYSLSTDIVLSNANQLRSWSTVAGWWDQQRASNRGRPSGYGFFLPKNGQNFEPQIANHFGGGWQFVLVWPVAISDLLGHCVVPIQFTIHRALCATDYAIFPLLSTLIFQACHKNGNFDDVLVGQQFALLPIQPLMPLSYGQVG